MPDPVPPLLPTTVVGSWSAPRWLEVVRDLQLQGRLSHAEADEAFDAAVKACLKDQELAGVDVVTDGELRRDSMIDFFARHIRGFRLYGPLHRISLLDPDLVAPDPVLEGRLVRGSLPLVPHWQFAQAHTAKPVKVCITGPHTLTKRCTHPGERSDRALAMSLGVILNAELRDLARAGCRHIQVDEPYWAGYPEEVRGWAVEVFDRLVHGVEAEVSLHVCYGNVRRQHLFPGLYREILPAMAAVRAARLVLELAVDDLDQLDDVVRHLPARLGLGLGVIDVKSDVVETPAVVAARLRTALQRIPPERLSVNPDCGFRDVRPGIALAKVRAMVEGVAIVRHELTGRR